MKRRNPYPVGNIMQSNLHSFGMLMKDRTFSSGDYRFSFNGKEKTDEISGEGNVYDYGFRIYNSGLGRFLSVDPLFQSYPWYTPYQFAGNNPIANIDLDGLEDHFASDGSLIGSGPFNNKTVQKLNDAHEAEKKATSSQSNANKIPPPQLNIAAVQSKATSPIVQPNSAEQPQVSSSPPVVSPTISSQAPVQEEPQSAPLDNVQAFGLAVNISQELFYSPTFNTWMGKDLVVRSQDWGGNGTTGGKNKFGKTTSKTLGAVNYGIGVYNSLSITDEMNNGTIPIKQGLLLQMDNAISTLAPPIVSVPKQIGNTLGEIYVDEISGFCLWLTKATAPVILNVPSAPPPGGTASPASGETSTTPPLIKAPN